MADHPETAAPGHTPADDTVAVTHAPGGAHPVEHESAFDPSGAEFWVYAGLTIFILLAIFVAKAPKRIAEALDARIAETRKELDRAYAIRQEAEKLLAEAQARNAASAGDAEAIVRHAESEAAALLAKAEKDADELMARRARMAEDKIAAAERAAVAEVRARAAQAATAAAGSIIAAQHDATADKALIDRTISGLARLN